MRFLTPAARRVVAQSMLTTSLLVALYAGSYVVREGNLIDGLHAAFLESNQEHAQRLADAKSDLMQNELRSAAQTDKVIHQVMDAVLNKASGAARVRLAVIHNGVTGVTGLSMLRFDITHFAAAPGRSGGPLLQNEPMSEWTDYLSTLLAGQCALVDASKVHSAAARARLDDLGVRVFMACPVIDARGLMLGGLFIGWDGKDTPPTGSELIKLIDTTKAAAGQIAAVLNLRPELYR